jgi:hypothetical protein
MPQDVIKTVMMAMTFRKTSLGSKGVPLTFFVCQAGSANVFYLRVPHNPKRWRNTVLDP